MPGKIVAALNQQKKLIIFSIPLSFNLFTNQEEKLWIQVFTK